MTAAAKRKSKVPSPAEQLPELLKVALEAGGWDAVRGLSKKLGGRRITIPKNPVGEHHPLFIGGGRAAADAIVRRYGDETVEFPKGKKALDRIIVERLKDQPINIIAAALDCTYRHAARLVEGSGRKPVALEHRAQGHTITGEGRHGHTDQLDLITDFYVKRR
jgi:hypothetical protein